MISRTELKLKWLLPALVVCLCVPVSASGALTGENPGGGVVIHPVIVASSGAAVAASGRVSGDVASDTAEASARKAEARGMSAEASAVGSDEGPVLAGAGDAASGEPDAKSGGADAQSDQGEAKPAAEGQSGEAEQGDLVEIKEIRFSGNTVIDTAILEKVTADFRGRELDLEEINSVAGVVTMAYQERGYILAKAYVPEQEIADGVLQINVVEGNVGTIGVTGNTYYSDRVMKRYFTPQLRHRVIKESLLERGLLLNKEIPKSETRIVLRRGKTPGTADMVLDVQDELGVKFSMDYNNFAHRLIGEDRWGMRFQATDPWWGSTLDVRGTSGNQMNDSGLASMAWTCPVTSYGTKVGFSYLYADYVIGLEQAILGLEGASWIYGVKVTQPILKTGTYNLSVSAGYERKYSETYLQKETSKRDKLNVYSVSVDWDNLDRFLGKNILSMAYYHGKLYQTRDIAISRSNADMRYDRFTLDAIRIQKIYGSTNIMVRGSAQICGDRLVSMEQSVIGGYGTVRGHDPAAYLGDSGYVLSAELMFAPPFLGKYMIPKLNQRVSQMFQFAIFFDAGGVYITDAEADEEGNTFLTGYGAGLRIFYKDRFRFKVDVAFPRHDLPKDELDDKNTFWYFLCDVNFI